MKQKERQLQKVASFGQKINIDATPQVPEDLNVGSIGLTDGLQTSK
jgi:hypothetical protein